MSELLDTSLWAIIPAAGSGQRMGASLPKQYMRLAGQPMLQRTLANVLCMHDVAGVIVVLTDKDTNWSSIPASTDSRVHTCVGGQTRAQSVVSGLQYLSTIADSNTWVIVHDAARPLLSGTDVQRLLKAVYNSGSVGGILATPVSDTLKKSDEYNAIEKSVRRQDLWQAQTPQLFRSGDLLAALKTALAGDAGERGQEQSITDEASAMEMLGHSPLLVEALEPNFKVTRPADLLLAEALLEKSGEAV
jgi:2-C-methyl-D-erythritol 4-phosphate cytidylyltransferase